MARNSLVSILNLIDEAKEEQSVEQRFLNDLERSIELTEEKNRRKGSLTYKPSGMNCMRASYYTITDVEVPETLTEYNMIGVCNAGSDIHVRTQNAVMSMKENGMDCEWVNVEEFVKSRELTDLDVVAHTDTETKLYNKRYNMSFMCDGIVKYKDHYYILEFKTEASFKFQNRKEVDPKHYHQATAYSLSFGLDDVIFIYINRDLLQMKSYLLKVTGEMKQELVGYITECDRYIERKKVPPKPQNAGPKLCSYCKYREQCHKDG